MDVHPDIAERVRNCGERPMLAFDEAHRQQKWVRSDWRQVNVEKVSLPSIPTIFLTNLVRWKSLCA